MNIYDKIPNLLIDKNTFLEINKPNYLPNHHTQLTYLFCIILRIFIGILILSNTLNKNIIIILCLIVILGFGSKFLNYYTKKQNIWKNYLRHIISYITILIIQLLNIPNKNSISGLLIIIDTLLGQQSRYITTNMSRISPN